MRKGFTLIELLAVILILGIIALIAIPQVTNIIEEAKESAVKRSAEQYVKAVETYATISSMQGNTISGNLDVSNLTDLKIKGTLPNSGNVEISNNEVVNCTLYYDDYIARCANGGINILEEIDTVRLTSDNFSSLSWSEIIASIKAGNYDSTLVGATKTVDLGELGIHTLRVANTSTPSVCNNSNFSKTACGFVLEFADIIIMREVNTVNTNEGSWPASEIRTYINDTILNSFPSVIKNNMEDTMVVTGHGDSTGETNYTSVDKLYLLSTQEVYVEGSSKDTATTLTRQLDYYSNLGMTITNNNGAGAKKLAGSPKWWWLRTPDFDNGSFFFRAYSNGVLDSNNANYEYGVSPAFRIV